MDYTLKPGLVWLIRPMDTHSFRAEKEGSLRFINVAFRSNVWFDFLEFVDLEKQRERWDNSDTSLVTQLLGQDFVQAENVFHQAVQEALTDSSRLFLAYFWSRLVKWFEQILERRPEHPRKWLAEMVVALEEPAILRLGLSAQIKQLKLSSAHVSRIFKSNFGQTPIEYIIQKRLQLAARTLSRTDDKIIDVAFDCGFENLSYFYRRFKMQYGSTPVAYRKRSRRDIAP